MVHAGQAGTTWAVADAGRRRGWRWSRLAAWVLAAGCCAGHADTRIQALVQAAHAQVGVTLQYDGRYERIAYPGGDVPLQRGVCTDVVVRAYRAIGVDLQQRVHEDMRRAFAAYPRLWGLKRPDPNIDHRRVPNLAVYFARHGRRLVPSRDAAAYAPGDLVTWRLPGGLPHIGIVSSEGSAAGRPLIVHNIGSGTQVEDVLFDHPITGHFRYLPAGAAATSPARGPQAPAPAPPPARR